MGLLDGKVVLVTGAGRGIGRECAILAARQGAKVVANDYGVGLSGEGTDKGPAQDTVDVIRSEGGEAVANFESVTDLKAVNGMVQQAMTAFGGLHAITNPAGFLRDRMFHNMTEEEWDAIIQVHLRGHFNVVRASINHFRSQNEGAYVMWTSITGLHGNIGQANYGAAKLGIAGLARIIAMEGQRYQVRANTISPGAATRMTDSIPNRTPEQVAAREAQRASGESSPGWPAQLSVALMSPATASISGEIFGASGYNLSIYSQPRPIATYHRDGGWTADAIVADFMPRVEKDFTTLNRTPPKPAIPFPAA